MTISEELYDPNVKLSYSRTKSNSRTEVEGRAAKKGLNVQPSDIDTGMLTFDHVHRNRNLSSLLHTTSADGVHDDGEQDFL